MFKRGDSVKIISDIYGKFTRIIGFVELLIPNQPFDNKYQVRVVDPDNGETTSLRIPEDHLVLISESAEVIAPETIQVDITKYLSENQMRDIAARVYEEHVTKFVDDVLERRTPPYGGIVDQILMATVERYVTKLADTFENAFLAKAKECVELKDPGNDNHTTFQEQLTFKLANAADKYIDANLPKIHDIMASTINDAATKLQINDISTKIARKIDLTKIISEIILEHSSI